MVEEVVEEVLVVDVMGDEDDGKLGGHESMNAVSRRERALRV